MALEVEVKLQVDSHAAVRERMKERGARFMRRVLETNRLFDTRKGRLRKKGCGLRVRSCRAEEGDAPPAMLTFKGPRQPGPMKKREEIETILDDAEVFVSILHRVGFAERICFEKRRESWQLGDCSIELDEVPWLGTFVEIEGPDEDRIRDVQRQLGLADHPIIRSSYVALLHDYCHQHNLSTLPIRFPA
jgi:adenylate cyclase class 2